MRAAILTPRYQRINEEVVRLSQYAGSPLINELLSIKSADDFWNKPNKEELERLAQNVLKIYNGKFKHATGGRAQPVLVAVERYDSLSSILRKYEDCSACLENSTLNDKLDWLVLSDKAIAGFGRDEALGRELRMPLQGDLERVVDSDFALCCDVELKHYDRIVSIGIKPKTAVKINGIIYSAKDSFDKLLEGYESITWHERKGNTSSVDDIKRIIKLKYSKLPETKRTNAEENYPKIVPLVRKQGLLFSSL